MTAMTLVSTVAVGSGGATSVDFNSIPQTGKTLLVLSSIRTNDNAGGTFLRFNGSSANYNNRLLQGNGSSVISYNNITSAVFLGDLNNQQNLANTFSNVVCTIPNYTSATAFKRYAIESVSEDNVNTANQMIITGRWQDTSAITSITLTTQNAGQAFVQHSSFSLYIIS